MLRHLWILLILLLVLPGLAERVPSRAEVLKAIGKFEADPLGESAQSKTMIAFATGSSDVLVHMTPFNFPPLEEKQLSEEATATLATAFMCGNLKAQLALKKKEDQSVPGLRSMPKVYQQMKKADPTFRSAGLEKLAALDASGQLAKNSPPKRP